MNKHSLIMTLAILQLTLLASECNCVCHMIENVKEKM